MPLTSGSSLGAESEGSDNESDEELHDCQKFKSNDFLAGIEVHYIVYLSIVARAGNH